MSNKTILCNLTLVKLINFRVQSLGYAAFISCGVPGTSTAFLFSSVIITIGIEKLLRIVYTSLVGRLVLGARSWVHIGSASEWSVLPSICLNGT